MKDQVKTKMRHLLGIHNEGGGDKYLGIPEQFGRKKKENLEYVTAKVKAKTNGWHHKFLSPGGKEVLTKSIASTMPLYPINVFKLPKKVCGEINNHLAQFWWSKSDGSNGMHWFAWQRMSLPKKEGGMRFRDFENSNDALLAKPNSLMARVLKGKYFPHTNILNTGKKKQSSYIWNSLLHGQALLKRGL